MIKELRPVDTGRPRKLFFQVLLTRLCMEILCQGRAGDRGDCAKFSSLLPGNST